MFEEKLQEFIRSVLADPERLSILLAHLEQEGFPVADLPEAPSDSE